MDMISLQRQRETDEAPGGTLETEDRRTEEICSSQSVPGGPVQPGAAGGPGPAHLLIRRMHCCDAFSLSQSVLRVGSHDVAWIWDSRSAPATPPNPGSTEEACRLGDTAMTEGEEPGANALAKPLTVGAAAGGTGAARPLCAAAAGGAEAGLA
ncbi:hypothetical protein EYF80_036754 [Liparis tanakae]|uniref:Uncharacterized protein n=1 Tax=Liparis tanakae TaxID=230148 RepID=A0A4Z2GIN6_9TELE|nr:hypothetical protein EYF80_036754 [Liparis tanakae]